MPVHGYISVDLTSHKMLGRAHHQMECCAGSVELLGDSGTEDGLVY